MRAWMWITLVSVAVACGDDAADGDRSNGDGGGAGQSGQSADAGASGSGRGGSGGRSNVNGGTGANSGGRSGTSANAGRGGSGGSSAPMDAGLDAMADAAAQDSAVNDAAGNPSDLPVDTTDKTKFFGDSRCDGLDVLLCEDFEDTAVGAVPGAPWTVRKAGGATLEVDDERAARGARSLHLVVDDTQEDYLRLTDLFPVEGNRLYGRVFFYVAAPIPRMDYTVHWNLVEGTGPNGQGGTKLVRYGGTYNMFNGGYLWNFEQRPRPGGFNELGKGDQHALETDEWVCFEWSFAPDETHGFRNGAEVPELLARSPVRDTEFTYPTYDGLNIGWAIYQQVDVPFHVWIDEIALDDERIGCAR